MKVLIANVLKDNVLKNAFDSKMDDLMDALKFNKETVYIEDLNKIHSFSNYSHFIISGSEASVLEWEPWYGSLEILVNRFTESRKPILGICFGHQFLAQVFCGVDAVKKAEKPEFGWTDILHDKDELFNGIRIFKSFVLHYDEVVKLDDRFKVIAQSNRCRIHAFKMIDKPIWGVQFHPDFRYEDTSLILERIRVSDPKFSENYVETFVNKEIYDDSIKIFENFILT